MLASLLVYIFLITNTCGFSLTSQFVNDKLRKSSDNLKLDLYSCDITSIDLTAFVNAADIVSLDLSHNEITEIQVGTFNGLFLLEELNLGKFVDFYFQKNSD